MQDEPTPTELLKAVADFLRNEITPAIKGHNAFKLRVGINALDLVTRQLTLAEGSDAAEAGRLKELLGADGSLIELNRARGASDGSREPDQLGSAEHAGRHGPHGHLAEPVCPRQDQIDRYRGSEEAAGCPRGAQRCGS